MVVREATAVGDRTMIRMFSRLEASVGRATECARAFCAARSTSRARPRAGSVGWPW